MAVSPPFHGGQASTWDFSADVGATWESTGQLQGITTNHWIPNSVRDRCAGPQCTVRFSLFDRQHHCRRCGEVMCQKCTAFTRRLNLLANPDPNGKLYRVCKVCFDKGPQTIGQSQSLLQLYRLYRHGQGHLGRKVTRKSSHAGDGGVNTCISNFRDKLDLEAECSRLKEGFLNSINEQGTLKGTFHNLLSTLNIKIPEWQKSPFYVYGTIATTCSSCSGKISNKVICAVCGVGVCGGKKSNCSSSDLLLYIPDGSSATPPLQAQISIVKIVGCPPVEPKTCTYLPVCSFCQQSLEDAQVSAYHQQRAALQESTSEENTFWDKLMKVDSKLRELQCKVDQQLPKYQELIEALEIAKPSGGDNSATRQVNNRSNMQVLAKAQGDLGDHLTSVAMMVQSMKAIKPSTHAESTLVKNFIRSKCDFYQENMFLYRGLRRKLETVTPLEVLAVIQNIVDKNAINSCYVTVRQLALEVLHLCSTHKLPNTIVHQLAVVENLVHGDLQKALLVSGEPWDEHERCVAGLIREQLGNKDRRLVRPSRRLTQLYGSQHVESIIKERSLYTLRQIWLQLSAKCSDSSFSRTKTSVQDAAEQIQAGTTEAWGSNAI